jgi:serine protease
LFDNETKTGLLKDDYKITSMETPFHGIDSGLSLVYRIHFDKTELVDSLVKSLEQNDFIEYAEKVPLYRISYVPDDIKVVQWGLYKINAELAWGISKGSSNVVIAVVDNAVNTMHNDLAANIEPNSGYDITDGDNNPNPPAGIGVNSEFNHGTHVSGIASAVTDNGFGIASLGFSCKIMPVKCATDNSSGQYLSNPFDGVYYAANANANIINMSFESSAKSATEQDIADFAYSLGVVLVAAAGNDSSSSPVYPAACNHVIGVGATDQNDLKTVFSNYGQDLDVLAPGNNIYSTMGYSNNVFGYYSGTSMSSPLVCGLAGLILSENPKLSPDQVKSYIERGCVNIDALNPGFKNQLGHGRIDAYNTLKLVQSDLGNYVNNNKINIYPNPSNGLFNLQFLQDYSSTNITIDVYNTLGSKVYEETLTNYNSHFHSIDLSSLAIGLYIVQINILGSIINMKITKG